MTCILDGQYIASVCSISSGASKADLTQNKGRSKYRNTAAIECADFRIINCLILFLGYNLLCNNENGYTQKLYTGPYTYTDFT